MTTGAISPADARRTWRSFEAVHGMIYFTPLAAEEYAAVGLVKHRRGHFASRFAAMGPVDAEVVIATFFNFHHDLVRHAMAGVMGRERSPTPEANPAMRDESRFGTHLSSHGVTDWRPGFSTPVHH